jgi:hypothetical protein
MGAKAMITQFLGTLGLQSLGDWAWKTYNDSGGSMDYVNVQLPQQQAFKDRFPEYEALAATGDAMTPAQIISAEQQAGQLLEQYGVSGMDGYDPRTVTAALLTGHVSMNEFDQRLQLRQAAAAAYHPDVHDQLNNLYGIDSLSALTKYVTDPTVALPVIQQQILAAQNAAAAKTTGFGQLSQGQAEHLAQMNISPAQAQQGFGQIAGLGQLQTALPGESGQGVSADQMINAQFAGNAQDTQALQAEQARRQSQFNQRGGFAGSQSGLSGTGPATTG